MSIASKIKFGGGNAKFFDNTPKIEELKQMLDSQSSKANIEGMKNLLAVRVTSLTNRDIARILSALVVCEYSSVRPSVSSQP